ncbi:MAG: cardiolipin synthase [Bacilli bacterium]|nr:cardiolipin synthase [Bacilli bacterium]
MFKKLKKFFTSRIVWTSLLLAIEIALIFVFAYSIVGSFMSLFNLTDWQVWIIVIVLLYVISFLIVVYIVNSHAKPAYKITWLVVVAILPLLGSFFYLLFGNKKITYRQQRKIQPIYEMLTSTQIEKSIADKIMSENYDAYQMANYITRASGGDLYQNSNVTYYPSGEKVFPEMIKELKKAKKFIFIEYFIIAPGVFWNSILDILKEKVKEGVDVRLIYDDVGSAGYIPLHYEKKLNAMGIKTVAFHKFKPLLDVKINNRDHRKIMVIDGLVGFSGGINLADEYINKIKRFGYWKDNAIKIEGSAVDGLTTLFLTQWLSINETDLTQLNLFRKNFEQFFPEHANVNGNGYVQPYGDLPYNEEAVGERVYLNLISRAKRYVYITTPYLIIDDEIVNALTNAVKKGVDVRIATPHIPDKKITFGITRSHYRVLLKNGVKIYEYTPGFIHMKMFVVDDIYATVGTINLDYRSLYLHLENSTFMYRCYCISDMKKDFDDIFKASEEITYHRYKKYLAPRRFIWSVLRMFAPLL